MECGHVAASHRRSLDEINTFWKRRMVEVGMMQHAVLRIAGHAAAARAMIAVTDAAVVAHAASLRERNHYARAALQILHVLADLLDHAGELVTEDRGQPW